MAYADFTVESAEKELGITTQLAVLFPSLEPLSAPPWLKDQLARGMQLARQSEKARSEFIVAPILLAVREQSDLQIAIFSGQRLDVDPARHLVGECDFILARTDPIPRLRAPLVTIVEAKKNDIDVGMGQCIAQMVAAKLFNERSDTSVAAVYGCVTTGEDWQFLRLVGSLVTIDLQRYYINNVESILAAFYAATKQPS